MTKEQINANNAFYDIPYDVDNIREILEDNVQGIESWITGDPVRYLNNSERRKNLYERIHELKDHSPKDEGRGYEDLTYHMMRLGEYRANGSITYCKEIYQKEYNDACTKMIHGCLPYIYEYPKYTSRLVLFFSIFCCVLFTVIEFCGLRQYLVTNFKDQYLFYILAMGFGMMAFVAFCASKISHGNIRFKDFIDDYVERHYIEDEDAQIRPETITFLDLEPLIYDDTHYHNHMNVLIWAEVFSGYWDWVITENKISYDELAKYMGVILKDDAEILKRFADDKKLSRYEKIDQLYNQQTH